MHVAGKGACTAASAHGNVMGMLHTACLLISARRDQNIHRHSSWCSLTQAISLSWLLAGLLSHVCGSE